MNRQEVFDKVRTHLLAQGRKSVIHCGTYEETCAYRSLDGSCAVGCLIPDELYDPEIEGTTVEGLLTTNATIAVVDGLPIWTAQVADSPICRHLGIENLGDVEFLQQLQKIHDTVPPAAWADQLEAFRQKHGLA